MDVSNVQKFTPLCSVVLFKSAKNRGTLQPICRKIMMLMEEGFNHLIRSVKYPPHNRTPSVARVYSQTEASSIVKVGTGIHVLRK
jgi:hypothetical protein